MKALEAYQRVYHYMRGCNYWFATDICICVFCDATEHDGDDIVHVDTCLIPILKTRMDELEKNGTSPEFIALIHMAQVEIATALSMINCIKHRKDNYDVLTL